MQTIGIGQQPKTADLDKAISTESLKFNIQSAHQISEDSGLQAIRSPPCLIALPPLNQF